MREMKDWTDADVWQFKRAFRAVALAAGAAFLITSTVEIMKAPPPEPAPVTGQPSGT